MMTIDADRLSEMSERLSRREKDARCVWAVAVADTAAGGALSDERVEELAVAMATLRLSPDEFRHTSDRFKELARLRAAVATLGGPDARRAADAEHFAYVAATREAIENLQKDLRVQVARFDTSHRRGGDLRASLEAAERDCRPVVDALGLVAEAKAVPPDADAAAQPKPARKAVAAK